MQKEHSPAEVTLENNQSALQAISDITSDTLMEQASEDVMLRALEFASRIDLRSAKAKDIRELGMSVTSSISEKTDKLLTQCSVTKAGDIGKEINELAIVAERITASTVVPTGLAAIIDKFKSYKGNHMKLVKQLDSIVQSVEKCGNDLQDSLDFLDSIREATTQQFTELEVVEIGIGILIENQRDYMLALPKTSQPFEILETQQKMAALQTRQKDIAGQRVQCQIAVYESMLIMIINQKYTDLLTYQIANTIPAAKTQIIHALGIKASRDAAQLSKSLNSTLNKMVEKNADAVLTSVKELKEQSKASTFNTPSLEIAASKVSEAMTLLKQANNISVNDHAKAMKEIHGVLDAMNETSSTCVSLELGDGIGG